MEEGQGALLTGESGDTRLKERWEAGCLPMFLYETRHYFEEKKNSEKINLKEVKIYLDSTCTHYF